MLGCVNGHTVNKVVRFVRESKGRLRYVFARKYVPLMAIRRSVKTTVGNEKCLDLKKPETNFTI